MVYHVLTDNFSDSTALACVYPVLYCPFFSSDYSVLLLFLFFLLLEIKPTTSFRSRKYLSPLIWLALLQEAESFTFSSFFKQFTNISLHPFDFKLSAVILPGNVGESRHEAFEISSHCLIGTSSSFEPLLISRFWLFLFKKRHISMFSISKKKVQ